MKIKISGYIVLLLVVVLFVVWACVGRQYYEHYWNPCGCSICRNNGQEVMTQLITVKLYCPKCKEHTELTLLVDDNIYTIKLVCYKCSKEEDKDLLIRINSLLDNIPEFENKQFIYDPLNDYLTIQHTPVLQFGYDANDDAVIFEAESGSVVEPATKVIMGKHTEGDQYKVQLGGDVDPSFWIDLSLKRSAYYGGTIFSEGTINNE